MSPLDFHRIQNAPSPKSGVELIVEGLRGTQLNNGMLGDARLEEAAFKERTGATMNQQNRAAVNPNQVLADDLKLTEEQRRAAHQAMFQSPPETPPDFNKMTANQLIEYGLKYGDAPVTRE